MICIMKPAMEPARALFINDNAHLDKSVCIQRRFEMKVQTPLLSLHLL